MKPVDIRNANWVSLRSSLAGRLAEVYTAWVVHGRGTTRQLADASGIDLLNVRPRTTDLVTLGLVELVDRHDGEGIYRAVSQSEWHAWHAERICASTSGQLTLI